MKQSPFIVAGMALLALNTEVGTQARLVAYRKQIDSLDERIVQLIEERARLVEQIGYIKREAGQPVFVPSREQQVIERAQEWAKGGPLPPETVGRIYQKLVQEMRDWEAQSR